MHDEPSSEVAREITLQWRLGGRAAAAIIRVANEYRSDIQLSHAGYAVDAKDILYVLTLSVDAKPEDVTKVGGFCLKAGAKIRLSARGTDALATVCAIESVFSNPDLDFDRRAERSD
ncbi:MAG: HPr family phosphocarrier protein [Verrucomicrobiota bacterium]